MVDIDVYIGNEDDRLCVFVPVHTGAVVFEEVDIHGRYRRVYRK